MKATALFVFLLALTACCSAESTFRWGYYTVNGVDGVQVFDLDKDGSPEVYAVSWIEPTRPMLRAFNSNGDLLYEILVPRPALIAYGEERITYLRAVDLDDDGLLDILVASEIVSAGVNSHRLYRFEKIFEEDLKRYRTDMLWYSRIGYTSGMALIPSAGEGIQEDIYQASSDFSLRILDKDGKALGNKTLETSIYDIYPVHLDAGRRGLAVASFQHVYVVDSSLKVLWDYNYQDRFTRVYASDVDKDGTADVFAFAGDTLYRFSRDGIRRWGVAANVETNIFSADLNKDGFEELIYGGDSRLKVLDSSGKLLWTIDLGDKPRYVFAYDFDKNGEPSIILGLENGFKVYDSKAFVNETMLGFEEAKRLLASAGDEADKGNFRNALTKAEKAREFFAMQNDSAPLAECDAIMERSRLAVSASEYYDQALGYFESGFYEEAMNYTLKSFNIYQQLNIADGVKKNVELNRSIFYSLYGASNATLGDSSYRKAEYYYINSNFLLSAEYARNASMYYEIAGEETGLAKAENLLRLALEKTPPSTTTTSTTIPTPVKKTDYMDYALAGAVILFLVILFLAFRKK